MQHAIIEQPLDSTVLPRSRNRVRNKKLEVMVAEVHRETADATTLVLFTGNDNLEYKPGHFLTIDPHQFHALERFIDYFEQLKGRREPARAYSLSSAPHEHQLAITIKAEHFEPGKTPYPPLLSPLLVWRTVVGTRMEVTGFSGPYVLPEEIEARTDHLVHICAGSGVVPNMSMIKHALHHRLGLRHTLILGNRTSEDVLFRRQLEDLGREHPGRLSVVHALSREAAPPVADMAVHPGRVSEELIRAHVREPDGVEVFVCGPAVGKRELREARREGRRIKPRFMETVLEALDNLGVPKERIHRESYG